LIGKFTLLWTPDMLWIKAYHTLKKLLGSKGKEVFKKRVDMLVLINAAGLWLCPLS